MSYSQLFKAHASKKGWTPANTDDTILFLVSEVGEVCDARLRMNPTFIRNYDRETDLALELAQVVYMAFRTADTLGIDLDSYIKEKYNAKS